CSPVPSGSPGPRTSASCCAADGAPGGAGSWCTRSLRRS
ncbi:MAG: hypothetical protein AVDCRST_MAG54-496, partial [uncultured Actinomycetospora sp.]